MNPKSAEYHGLVFTLLSENNSICLEKLEKSGTYRLNGVTFWIKHSANEIKKKQTSSFSFTFNEDDKLFLTKLLLEKAYLALVCVTDKGSEVALLNNDELDFLHHALEDSSSLTVSYRSGEKFRLNVRNAAEKLVARNRLTSLLLEPALCQPPERHRGYIKGCGLAFEKGYGFIVNEQGEDVFFHKSALLHRHIDFLEGGEKVSYQLSDKEEGKACAINILFEEETEGEKQRRNRAHEEVVQSLRETQKKNYELEKELQNLRRLLTKRLADAA
ncbi:MAG: cold-shock protein [Cyclobacteriaceae bacterium]